MSDQSIVDLTAAVTDLSGRVELAADINDRQKELSRLQKSSSRRNFGLFAVVVLMVGGFWFQGQHNASAQCKGQNQLRTAEVGLWTDAIAKSPIPPLKADATAAEIEAHNKQVKATESFIVSLNQKFALLDC